MDGSPAGRIKCTLANWTGVVYKIPRTELEKCRGRDDLSQSGVYFLFGLSDETGENVVYVGQAGTRKNGEGILYRLQEHKRNPGKGYWTEAIVLTTSDNSFGPTEINYLENRFCNLAISAGRYRVKNGIDPSSGNTTEEKESELEEFADYAKIAIGTLGHKVFEPLTGMRGEPGKDVDEAEPLLYFRRKSGKSGEVIEANCRQTPEGFVVLKGSRIETIDSKSVPPVIKESRQKAIIDGDGILQEDMLFRSPSYAASFVIGSSANGLTEWKTSKGLTLKEAETGL